MQVNKVNIVKKIIFTIGILGILLFGASALARQYNYKNLDININRNHSHVVLDNNMAVDKAQREEKLNQYYYKVNILQK